MIGSRALAKVCLLHLRLGSLRTKDGALGKATRSWKHPGERSLGPRRCGRALRAEGCRVHTSSSSAVPALLPSPLLRAVPVPLPAPSPVPASLCSHAPGGWWSPSVPTPSASRAHRRRPGPPRPPWQPPPWLPAPPPPLPLRAPAAAFVASAAAPRAPTPGARGRSAGPCTRGARGGAPPQSRAPRAPETLRTRADPPPRPVGVTWWVWARRRGDGPPLSWHLGTRGSCCRAPRFSGASLFLFCSAGPSACRRLLGSLSPELLCRACGNRYSWLWALKFLRYRNLAEDTACPSGILCSSGWCCCPQPHLLSCSKEVTDSKSRLVTKVAYFLYILENSWVLKGRNNFKQNISTCRDIESSFSNTHRANQSHSQKRVLRSLLQRGINLNFP